MKTERFTRLLNRLNGWQRLWFVLTVIGLVVSIILVYRTISGSKKLIRGTDGLMYRLECVDDVNEIAKLNEHKTKKIRLTNGMEAIFPNNMTDKDIDIVMAGYSGMRPWYIKIAAEGFVQTRNIKEAERCRWEKAEARRCKRRAIVKGISTWGGISASVYVCGLVVGWIYNGFRTSRSGKQQ